MNTKGRAHIYRASVPISADNFPKLFSREIGAQDGFLDGAKLSEVGESSSCHTGATIRIRKKIADRLRAEGWPYFVGYVRGRELFDIYLGGTS